MFGVILSLEPDVVLALLFYPLQRKHTLIHTTGEAVPNVSVGLLCDSVCSERMSELGHFTIENLHKIFLLG